MYSTVTDEDEDIIVKLLVFGSTGICTFILFLMLLILIVWNYLSSPTGNKLINFAS